MPILVHDPPLMPLTNLYLSVLSRATIMQNFMLLAQMLKCSYAPEPPPLTPLTSLYLSISQELP